MENKTRENNILQVLKRGAEDFGVHINDMQLETFALYMRVLREKNNVMNLTAIKEEEEIAMKHFVDSLSILPVLDQNIPEEMYRLVDIGSGAGFPGVPVSILRSRVHVMLLDSVKKKVDFLNELTGLLSLSNAAAVCGRAEALGREPQYREQFDVGVARAVALLPVLCEYCLPFVKVGGILIAMKGGGTEDTACAERACDLLGGKIIEEKKFVLPDTEYERRLIVIKKCRQISPKYPRNVGKPLKSPL